MFFSFLRSRGGSVWRRHKIPNMRVLDRRDKTSKRTLECTDDERGRGRHDSDLGLTVLDGELYGDAQALPSGCCFCNIFTDLLRRLKKMTKIQRRYASKATRHTHKAEWTDLWCKRGRSTNLTTSRSEVNDFDFVGVLQARRVYQQKRTKTTAR